MLEAARKNASLKALEEHSPANTLILDCSLQNCETINLCWFKPSSLWYCYGSPRKLATNANIITGTAATPYSGGNRDQQRSLSEIPGNHLHPLFSELTAVKTPTFFKGDSFLWILVTQDFFQFTGGMTPKRSDNIHSNRDLRDAE